MKITRITKGLAKIIVQDKNDSLDYQMYLQLHSFHEGGCIFDIKTRYAELVKEFGCCESKIRVRIGSLCKRGWAYKQHGHLFMVSQNVISKEYGLKHKAKHRILFSKDIKPNLLALSIKENFAAQEFKIKEKCIDIYTKHKYGIIYSRGTIKKLKSKEAKSYRSDPSAYQQRVLEQCDVSKDQINPNPTLSRKSVGKLIGSNSSSSGSRYIKRLVNLGLITDKRDYKVISNKSTLEEFYYLKGCYSILGVYIFFYKEQILLPLCNQLSLTGKNENWINLLKEKKGQNLSKIVS